MLADRPFNELLDSLAADTPAPVQRPILGHLVGYFVTAASGNPPHVPIKR
jgi:hypothetical protein